MTEVAAFGLNWVELAVSIWGIIVVVNLLKRYFLLPLDE